MCMCVSAPTLPAALKTLDLVVGAAGAGATATALYLLTYPQKVTVSSLLQGSAASRSVSLFILQHGKAHHRTSLPESTGRASPSECPIVPATCLVRSKGEKTDVFHVFRA